MVSDYFTAGRVNIMSVTYLDFYIDVRRFVDTGRDHRQFHNPVDGHKVRDIRMPRCRHDDSVESRKSIREIIRCNVYSTLA